MQRAIRRYDVRRCLLPSVRAMSQHMNGTSAWKQLGGHWLKTRIGWTEKSLEAVHWTDINGRNGLLMTRRAQRLFGA
jgi:hypothetical protein